MAVDGRLEAVIDGRVVGWVWCPADPGRRVGVSVSVDGREVAAGCADLPRASLAAAGIGDGSHVFSIALPQSFADGERHAVRVLAGADRTPLPAAAGFSMAAADGNPFAGAAFVPDGDPCSPGDDPRSPGDDQSSKGPQALERRAWDAAWSAASPVSAWLSRLPAARVESASATLPRWLLAAGCGLYAVVILYLSRHFGFLQDEYYLIVNRRGWGPGSLLAPVNQHLFLVPLLAYKLLWVTVGLHTHWPYEVMTISGQIGCVTGIYALAARRAGPWIALAAALFLLALGAGFENELWAGGMDALVSVAAGLWALVFLERRDRRGNVWAATLIGFSIACFSVGLFLAVAIAIALALTDRRRLWVVGVPLALYALWYAAYGQSDVLWSNLPSVPLYDVKIGAYGFAGLLGFSSHEFGGGTPLVVGLLLLGAGVILVTWELVRHRRLPSLAVIGIVSALAFWTGTALARANYAQPDASRYVTSSAAFIVLAAVGLLRMGRIRAPLVGVLALALALDAGLGAQALRSWAIDYYSASTYTRVALGAAEVAAAAADPAFQPDAHHISFVTLGPYLAAVKDLGSPAFSPNEIARLSSDYQELADSTLIAAETIGLHSTSKPPASVTCSQSAGTITLQPGRSLFIVAAHRSETSIWLRRLSASFPVDPQLTLTAGTRGRLDFPRDASSIPWRVRMSGRATGTACVT